MFSLSSIVPRKFSLQSYTRIALVACVSSLLGISTPSSMEAQTPDATVTVGAQPGQILVVGDQVHVFCNQVDINFDGVLDEADGDRPSSWWILDAKTNDIVSSKNFEWNAGYGFNSKPFLDSENGRLYVTLSGGSIRAFDPTTQGTISATDITTDLNLRASSYSNSNEKKVFTVSPSFSSPGYALVAHQVGIAPFASGTFVNQNNETVIWVVSQGSFGGSNSSVHFIAADGTVSSLDELGDTANDVLQTDDSLIITMNGSDEVVVVNLQGQSVAERITVGAGTGYGNGPRASLVKNDTLIVSAWGTNDIRRFSLSTGEILDSIPQTGKPNGIALYENNLLVALQYAADSFASDSTVAIWDLQTVSSIESDKGTPANARIFVSPNPSSERVRFLLENINATSPTTSMKVYSFKGALIAENLPAHFHGTTLTAELSTDALSLSSGHYFVVLSIDDEEFTVPFQVKK